MTSVNRQAAVQLLTILTLLSLLVGCGTAHVVVEGKFPPPLIAPLPMTLGVWFGNDFTQHEFIEEAGSRQASSWVVSTGAAQVQMWNTLLAGMFTRVVHLQAPPSAGQTIPNVDAVLIPHIEELQYATPAQTSINVYEIWMRYRFEMRSADGAPIAEWTMTSYGKTPTAILQSAEAAVNLAAVMALRDAGANFATNFTRVPAVANWLREENRLTAADTP